jgi:hypothetical protein
LLEIRHRARLNADLNIGLSATVSARASKVAGSSLAFFFHHDGIRPRRIGTSSFLPSRVTTVLIGVVGQKL